MSNDRLFTAHIRTTMYEGGVGHVETMHLTWILVHLSVILTNKGLANDGGICREHTLHTYKQAHTLTSMQELHIPTHVTQAQY